MAVRAFTFPGQGSQAVGMGVELAAAFPVARHLFEEVDEALQQKLSRLMAEGPESELLLTENAQPALMAVSLATLKVVEEQSGKPIDALCRFVAGHSLGEYSALAAAGSFTIADAARLLKLRGQAMQKAVPVGVGAMAALIGLELEPARAVAAEAAQGQVCDIGNDNAPGQCVASGHKEAVERAVQIAPSKGGRRGIMLPVSAPFHSALMAPAAEVMEKALGAVAMRQPAVPLIANVAARPVSDALEIKRLLVQQVTHMVRWRESVLAMVDADVDTLVELGSGKVLSGLARRIHKELTAISMQTPAEVDAFLKTL
ncbi:MAG: ACP S-malonyltransferase [Proteobacteria bacterium]|nr:ACP S-malonyltransferase [Pseudomonadota bacterium]